MKLGVITDGISRDFEHALDVMNELGLRHAELQFLWDKEVGDLDDAEIAGRDRLCGRSVHHIRRLVMRFMVKVQWDVEAGNNLAKAGTIGSTVGSILDELKPEAAYFSAEGGKRGATLIVNLDDASQLPAVAEPWFLACNASIEFLPVMLLEDLEKAGDSIGQAVEKYG